MDEREKEPQHTDEKSQSLIDLMEEYFGKMSVRPEMFSALGLAYIGDAVYDMIVRTLVMSLGNGKVKKFHKMTSNIVKAEAQAAMVKEILPYLSEEEMRIYKHGRNAKSATSAKNASIVDYRLATGLEALVGYLYLKHELKRILELMQVGLEKTGQMPRHL